MLMKFLTNLISLFYPDLCIICGNNLVEGEQFLCLHCLHKIPKTFYHLRDSNPAEQRLRGKIPYEKISSFLYFEKGGETQKMIHQIKYKGNKKFARWLGELMAEDIKKSTFFNDIDYIVPVPSHKKRIRQRGFNQAEELAKGISQTTNIPINTDCLQKTGSNISQTRKGVYERWINNQYVFSLKDEHSFSGKHILLIDDVMTTGATLESCAQCITTCNNTKISILTLAITR